MCALSLPEVFRVTGRPNVEDGYVAGTPHVADPVEWGSMDQELREIVESMRSTHDRDISVHDERFLGKMVQERRALTSCRSAADYAALLRRSSDEAAGLHGALNNAHSAFFRDPLTFALFEQLILPSIRARKTADGGQEIRVWSVGCARGEEAYSLAILLEDMARAHGGQTPYRIFATDLSEANLARARHGTYRMDSLQEVRQKHMRDYFTPGGDGWRIDAGLRDRVAFSHYDLLDERTSSPPPSVFGEFDLIMCGNLLFYYRQEVQQSILGKLSLALAPHGFLATGEAERNIVAHYGAFRAVAPLAALFRKRPTLPAGLEPLCP